MYLWWLYFEYCVINPYHPLIDKIGHLQSVICHYYVFWVTGLVCVECHKRLSRRRNRLLTSFLISFLIYSIFHDSILHSVTLFFLWALRSLRFTCLFLFLSFRFLRFGTTRSFCFSWSRAWFLTLMATLDIHCLLNIKNYELSKK